jgi:pimeloyl-ACP methyl ester carboxylesterase
MDDSWIDANGLRIHYWRTGRRGSPIVVLLHGRADSGRVWARVAGHLDARFDVLMPDARGHGRTGGAVTGMSYEVLADDLVAFLDAVGADRPVLWGHSMGALTALLVAARPGPPLRAVILEDPPLRDAGRSEERVEERIAEAEARRVAPVEALVAEARARHPTWAPEELEPWAESEREFDPAILRMELPVDWRAAVARLRCPALLLTGDADLDAIVTPAVAAEVAGLAPAVTIVRIGGAGHSIHRDRYGPATEAVDAFLAVLDGND